MAIPNPDDVHNYDQTNNSDYCLGYKHNQIGDEHSAIDCS